MTKQSTPETVMTEIYSRNLWGCPTTRSGPTATVERTMELVANLPELFRSLGIESMLDVGCGDFSWMQHVDLTGIDYLGVDIVPDLVQTLQNSYTSSTVHFQKMNVLQEPPETADLWFCRDFLNLLDFQQTAAFFSKFLESKSLYLAVSSVETNQPNTDGHPGIQRMLDLFQEPFNIPNPTKILFDGEQWYRKRILAVYSRDDVEAWWQRAHYAFTQTTSEVDLPRTADDIQDRNASLKSNVMLKNYPIHGHMGLLP
jgi:hypothetical protein